MSNSANETREFVVAPEENGARLDLVLARRMSGWSRSQLQRLIRSGKVSVGGTLARKAGQELHSGERVTVQAEREEIRPAPEKLPLTFVYDDGDFLVVDKPAGMTVHAGAGVKSGTLVNALLHHLGGPDRLSKAGGELRPGIVHRLDRMTSGLVVVAKNDFAHRALAEQFKSREVHKTYVALVHGRVASDSGEIRRPVGRDPRRRVRMKAGGIRPREAVTRYRVMRRFERFTLVEAEPLTGRTHQIRVHLAAIGHPVVGDTLYGAPRKLNIEGREEPTLARNFLHAAGIEFRHPRTGQLVRCQAPLPAELQGFLERLSER